MSSGRVALNKRWAVGMGACVDAAPLVIVQRQQQQKKYTARHTAESGAGQGHNGTLGEREGGGAAVEMTREVVLVGSHSGALLAIEGSTGCILWQCVLPDRIEAAVSAVVLEVRIFNSTR